MNEKWSQLKKFVVLFIDRYWLIGIFCLYFIGAELGIGTSIITIYTKYYIYGLDT